MENIDMKSNRCDEVLQFLNSLLLEDKTNCALSHDSRNAASALKAKIENDIRENYAVGAGRASVVKAAGRIIKNAKCNSASTAYHGAFHSSGYTAVSDGHRLIAFSEDLPLEPVPEERRTINYDSFMDSTILKLAKDPGNISLKLPSLPDLKTYIKTKKAELKASGAWKKTPFVFYDFGSGLPLVNAEYLIDMLEALPGCTAVFNGCLNSPIFFKSENAIAELLPVRKTAN